MSQAPIRIFTAPLPEPIHVTPIVRNMKGGVTDGRFFARLGIQTHGFMPMPLPADFPVLKIAQTADER